MTYREREILVSLKQGVALDLNKNGTSTRSPTTIVGPTTPVSSHIGQISMMDDGVALSNYHYYSLTLLYIAYTL